MLNMQDNITVGELKDILESVDDNLIITTENVQDGINRHNDIVGYEDDADDEYFVFKIFNESVECSETLLDDLLNLCEDNEPMKEAINQYFEN